MAQAFEDRPAPPGTWVSDQSGTLGAVRSLPPHASDDIAATWLEHRHGDDAAGRRHQGSPSGRVELAAYSYDGGVKPYSPPNPNLLQPFSSLLLADGQTTYRLRMELPDAGRTVFVLSDASGAELERKKAEVESLKITKQCLEYANEMDRIV